QQLKQLKLRKPFSEVRPLALSRRLRARRRCGHGESTARINGGFACQAAGHQTGGTKPFGGIPRERRAAARGETMRNARDNAQRVAGPVGWGWLVGRFGCRRRRL